MRPEVRAAFIQFTDPLEGCCNFMYTDLYGLVTTGRGDLVDWGPRRIHASDPIGTDSAMQAMDLGWKDSGFLATQKAISDAWWIVKRSWPGVQSVACASLTTIRLEQIDVDALTYRKLDEVWAQLDRRFVGLETWPACAQLGLISMAWAMGAGFQFPKFEAAANAFAWSTCAVESHISNGSNARNAAQYQLFVGAMRGLTIDEALNPPPPMAA